MPPGEVAITFGEVQQPPGHLAVGGHGGHRKQRQICRDGLVRRRPQYLAGDGEHGRLRGQLALRTLRRRAGGRRRRGGHRALGRPCCDASTTSKHIHKYVRYISLDAYIVQSVVPKT